MAHWLLKTEPGDYSAADLEREKRTRWTGVANAQAAKNLRAIATGDEVVIYHTGDERACVAIARVTQAGDEPEIAFVRSLPTPVGLGAIKVDAAFKEWTLVKQGRLSVVPTDDAIWKRLMELAGL